MSISRVLLAGAFLVIFCAVVLADEIVFANVLGEFKPSVEQFSNGYVDWGNGYY